MRSRFVGLLTAAAACGLANPAAAQVGYEWSPQFAAPFFEAGTVYDAVVWDDGTGPALFVAGDFQLANGELCFSILKYDGTTWTPLSGGLQYSFEQQFIQGQVYALEVFDPDGSGSQPSMLIVGGEFMLAGGINPSFVSNIVAWDGLQWLPMGSGLAEEIPGLDREVNVTALEVVDNGASQTLYAGGRFRVNGDLGVTGNSIARWDGASWQPLGGGSLFGSSLQVRALQWHDDGSGPALYVGGYFDGAVGTPDTQGLARWNGTAWSGLAPGTHLVQAFVEFDADGAGPQPARLVGSVYGGLKVWDGTTLTTVPGYNGPAITDALAVFDDGNGPAVYLGPNHGGTPEHMPIEPSARMHKWDGVSATMTPVGAPFRGTTAARELFVYDDGGGEALWCGGLFLGVFGENGSPDVPSGRLVKWNGVEWQRPFPSGGLENLTNYPSSHDAVVADLDGDGPDGEQLIVCGIFDLAGGVVTNGIAAFDGTDWSAFGGGATEMLASIGVSPRASFVDDPVLFDDGTGPALYAVLTSSVGGGANDSFGVFKWNGAAWSPLGPGFGFDHLVRDLIVFDDGSGPALYATGWFTQFAGIPLSGIAKWDGASWTAVGGGLHLTTNTRPFVQDAHVFDDGTGPALFAVGGFNQAGVTLVSNIAKWNGSTWSAVGSGLNGQGQMCVTMDDGAGPALYVGGFFFDAGGVAGTNGIAKWNGAWSSVGGGVPSNWSEFAFLGTHNDGDRSRLYFSAVDFNLSFVSRQIMSYDPVDGWAQIPDGWYIGFDHLTKIVEFDGGLGMGIYLIGTFAGVGSSDSDYLNFTFNSKVPVSSFARWGGTAPPCPGDYNDDGFVDLADLISFNQDWQPSIGQSVTPGAPGDFNQDGFIDLADLIAFNQDWQPAIGIDCP